MSDVNVDDIATESTVPKKGVDAERRAADEKLLKIAHKEFKTGVTALEYFRAQAVEDQKFRAGSRGTRSYQWPKAIQDRREEKDRACLTVNRIPSFIRLVTNQARQANLRISVSAVDNYGDEKTAEVLQGIIRNIETQSFADRAYNMASDKQAEQGLGYIKLITEWAEPDNPQSFRQRVRIKRVKNPLSIVVAPCQEPDFSDAAYAFEITDLDKADYCELTGCDEDDVPTPASLEAFQANGDTVGDWFPNGKIRVANWYRKEKVGPRTRIAELSNGDVVPYPDEDAIATLKATGVGITRSRFVQKTQVTMRKIDGCKVIETSVWPADAQPFIPVIGDESEIEGERDYKGVTRDAKGPAQVYNVEVTALVEQVGLGTKSPVVGYRGQFGKEGENIRKRWENAQSEPVPFLEVEMVDIDGKPAPLPQAVNFEPPIQGTVVALRQADEDLKNTAGYREASLAQPGPQESGKAIKLRQDQDILMNSHFLDNLRFALASAGRQLIQLIRVVYDVPTVIRIMGTDEKAKKVMVFSGAKRDPRNDQFLETHPADAQAPRTMKDGTVVPPGGKVPFELPDGVEGIYDLGVGEFDVEVNGRPDHGTRRQEDLETITGVFRSLPPEFSSKFIDLYFMLIDSPIGRQMAERAKKLMPPPEDQQDGQPNPMQMQAQLGQAKQQFEALMQAYQAAQQELKTEQGKLDAQMQIKREEFASKEKIANEQVRGALGEKLLDHTSMQEMATLNAKIDTLLGHLDNLHARVMAQTGHDNATAAAEADAQRNAAAVAAAPAPGAEPAPPGAAVA